MQPADDHTGSDDDPVRSVADGDLQNLVTWEPRSRLDRFAVRLHGTIRTGAATTVVGIAALLMLGQLALTAGVLAKIPLAGGLRRGIGAAGCGTGGLHLVGRSDAP